MLVWILLGSVFEMVTKKSAPNYLKVACHITIGLYGDHHG